MIVASWQKRDAFMKLHIYIVSLWKRHILSGPRAVGCAKTWSHYPPVHTHTGPQPFALKPLLLNADKKRTSGTVLFHEPQPWVPGASGPSPFLLPVAFQIASSSAPTKYWLDHGIHFEHWGCGTRGWSSRFGPWCRDSGPSSASADRPVRFSVEQWNRELSSTPGHVGVSLAV